ncbi:MAG: tol-pal system protein YbgF [Parvibaculum sp.]|nr:tol-pal system protein YbgF [Parvibaculum sp.]
MRPDRRPLKSAFACVAAVALVGMPLIVAGTALAQSGDMDPRAVANRLDRIERELSDLQRQTYSGGGSSGAPVAMDSGAGTADLQARVVELEDRVRDLTGRLEEANHRAETLQRNLEAFQQDVDLRFQDAAGGSPAAGSGDGAGAQSSVGPGSSAAPAAGAAAGSAPSVLPNGTPETQYEFAIDLMKRGQYDKARAAFQEFLQIHPKNALAGNAQYWLGETYYAQNDYKRAGDAFLTGYTTYASSSKAPDSLLKLGMSLAALDNKDAACTVWGELGSKFPQASPSVVARARLERQKAGC